jgi:dynein heavy chain, axonemal
MWCHCAIYLFKYIMQWQLKLAVNRRYADAIRSEIDSVLNTLRVFGGSLEEWVELQRNWLRLEGVFCTNDFQRQMPEESLQFASVDRTVNSTTLRIRDDPNALKVRLHPYSPLYRSNTKDRQIRIVCIA